MFPQATLDRIHVGDEVALAIGGLNQAEYGTVPGKVISIRFNKYSEQTI